MISPVELGAVNPEVAKIELNIQRAQELYDTALSSLGVDPLDVGLTTANRERKDSAGNVLSRISLTYSSYATYLNILRVEVPGIHSVTISPEDSPTAKAGIVVRSLTAGRGLLARNDDAAYETAKRALGRNIPPQTQAQS